MFITIMRYAYCIYFTITIITCIAITITIIIIQYFRKKTLLCIAIGDRILKGNSWA